MHRTKSVRWLMLLALVAIGLSLGSAVMADDFLPPPWRGDPYTILAEYELDTIAPVGLADSTTLPAFPLGNHPISGPLFGYEVISNLVPVDLNGDLFTDGWQGTNAVNPGIIRFYLPNVVDTHPLKNFWAQFTYVLGSNTPTGQMVGSAQGAIPGVGTQINVIGSGGLPAPPPGSIAGTKYRIEEWVIEPNPDWETFEVKVPFQTTLLQLVIDTNSPPAIPEPGTYALFGLGAVVLLGIRRRRKAA
jgi:hypothetical protein